MSHTVYIYSEHFKEIAAVAQITSQFRLWTGTERDTEMLRYFAARSFESGTAVQFISEHELGEGGRFDDVAYKLLTSAEARAYFERPL